MVTRSELYDLAPFILGQTGLQSEPLERKMSLESTEKHESMIPTFHELKD
jgi:hypothetical protein